MIEARTAVDLRLTKHYGQFVGKLLTITLSRDDDGRRADRIVRKVLKDTALSTIYRLFRQGEIRTSNSPLKPNDRLKEGDIVEIRLPEKFGRKVIAKQ